jgi:hypothetical protein
MDNVLIKYDVVRSVEWFCSLTFEQLISVVLCTDDVIFALDEKALTPGLTLFFHIIDACGEEATARMQTQGYIVF